MAMRDFDPLWDRKTYISIKENFKELFNYYIKAGLDATEARIKAERAVADAILARIASEEARDIAESVRDDLQTIIREQTQNGDLAPEIAQARQGRETLGENLTAIKTGLKKTDDKLNAHNWELNSKGREKRGITVFTSDDGREHEYTVAKDIFQSEGVPQTIYLVSSWLNTPGFLTTEQALELQDLGWEIGSHSRTHPNNPVMKDNPDDIFVEREFWESKRDLINLGFDVQNYAYPGGNYAKRERMFAKKYYRSARCSDVSRTRGVNYTPLNSHEFKTIWLDPVVAPFRTYLEENDRATAMQMMYEYCQEAIDRAHDNKGILTISTHFKEIKDEDLQNLYRRVIRYAKTKTDVTTMRDALNRMGNIVETGDYSQYEYRAPGDMHYVVGADGLASGTATIAERNRFTPSSHFDDFPFGVTYCPVNSSHAQDAPEKKAGTLINHKTNTSQLGFNYQEYKLFGVKKTYVRFLDGDKKFSNWSVLQQSLHYDDVGYFGLNTPFNEFNVGITYSAISTAQAQDSTLPDKRQGYLITYKMGGINYQKYIVLPQSVLRAEYTRSVDSSGNYGAWTLYTPGMRLPDANNFHAGTPFSSFPLGVTHTIIQGNNSNVSLSPGGKNGTLITYKYSMAGPYGYNFQEYHVFNSSTGETYKRFALGTESWGDWVKVIG